jgi:hypothetical protein
MPFSCYIPVSPSPLCFIIYLFGHISFPQTDEYGVSKEDKIKFSMRTLRFLLPWLKEFHQEQMLEKSVEASIRGKMIVSSPLGCLA